MIPSIILKQISDRFPEPSSILDHGRNCCFNAKLWLFALDKSYSYFNELWHPPLWLRKQYEWGPMQWPVYWCSIPRMKTLDCGALAAVAVQLYRHRGQQVAQVQIVLCYPRYVVEQWSRMWQKEGLNASWIVDEFCYHEACGVINEMNEMLIWDPTESKWVERSSSPKEAFAAVVALRVGYTGVRVWWQGISLTDREWQVSPGSDVKLFPVNT